ncbi:MAG TPA: hypothetical protein VHR35_12605 [Nocardioides sp.]|jgi:hypothetical protein|nr:hypothetical protein [Nocardioides sp.]
MTTTDSTRTTADEADVALTAKHRAMRALGDYHAGATTSSRRCGRSWRPASDPATTCATCT